ncbi:hypothetical protein [Clostridium botulinum]|nr:hypothetical protein [Clostridium botulinum]MDU4596415.1 hypothetical protein [Clostridium sporogenes]
MARYSIMAFMFGYCGNKLFGKDKGTKKSIKIAAITATILIIVDLITLRI